MSEKDKRRFSLTVRQKKDDSVPNSPAAKLKNLFSKPKKGEEEEKPPQKKTSDAQKERRASGQLVWPAPGKVSDPTPTAGSSGSLPRLSPLDESGPISGSLEGSPVSSSPLLEATSTATSPQPELMTPSDILASVLSAETFVTFSEYESKWGEVVKEAPSFVAELFRSGRTARVNEYYNRHASSFVVSSDKPSVEFDLVKATSSFYAKPWVSIFLSGNHLSFPEQMPAILNVDSRPKLEPPRDVMRVSRVPFQAEPPARHFMLGSFHLQMPKVVEPVLVCVSVYDREVQQKLTGDMCLCFPGQFKSAQLPDFVRDNPDVAKRRAAFSVASGSRDTLFVFKFFKLWRANEDHRNLDCLQTMIDEEKRTYLRDTLRMAQDGNQGKYWEPFGVAFCPTLRPARPTNLNIVSSSRTVRTLEPLSGQIELKEIYDFRSTSTASLYELLSGAGSTPLLDGSLTFNVELDWSPDSQNAFLDGSVEAIPSFVSSLNVAVAAMNELFFYPRKLIGNTSIFTADSSIMLRVGFRPNSESPPLEIFSQFSVSGGDMGKRSESWTSTSRCRSCVCEFSDEIRLQLPLLLEPEAMLLITVYKVNLNEHQEVVEFNIPLYNTETNRFLVDGNHSVLLIPGLPKNSISSVSNGDTNNLPALNFATRFVSTVYFHDPVATATLRHLSGKQSSRVLQNILGCVSNIPRLIERLNFPIFLSGLLEVMYSSNTPSVSRGAFLEAVSFLDRLHMTFPDSSSCHHPFLQSYSTHVFTPPGNNFAEVMVNVWLEVLENLPSPAFVEKMTLSRVWVLLDVLMKAIMMSKSIPLLNSTQDSEAVPATKLLSPRAAAVEEKARTKLGSTSVHTPASSSPQMLRKQVEPAAPATNKSLKELREVSDVFKNQLMVLFGRLLAISYHHESADSVKLSILDVGKALREVFTCLDRGFCMNLLEYVVTYMNTLDWNYLVPDLLSVVFAMGDNLEDFISINMPSIAPLGQISEYRNECKLRHPLIGILVDLLKQDITADRAATSGNIWLLVSLLANHERHPIFGTAQPNGDEEDEEDLDDDEAEKRKNSVKEATSKQLEAVYSMYFQYVLMVLDMTEQAHFMVDTPTLPWYTSALIVLRKMSAELRQMWYFVDSVSGINTFLDFLLSGCRAAKETPVSQEVNSTVLLLLTDFCQQNDVSLKDSSHAPFIFSLLNALFDASTSSDEAFIKKLFVAAEMIATQYVALVFDEQNAPYCQMLVIPTIFLCNSSSAALRDMASKFLWRLIQLNDQHRGTFVQVRLACTIAISRLVTEKKAADTFRLKEALDSVVVLSSKSRPEMKEQTEEMMNRLFSVLKSTVLLSTFENEPEMKVDICFRISEGYSGSPDLRITWLKIVAKLHLTNKDYVEAAQTYLLAAYLISQYLDIAKMLPEGVNPVPVLQIVCPYLRSSAFVGISRDDVNNKGTALRLEVWTVDGLCDVLYEAAIALADGQRYNWSLDCFNLLIAIRKPRGQYLELLKAYAGAQMSCKNLIKAVRDNVEPKFFRVHFIGAAFDKINNKAFVYRGDSSQRLMDFSQFLVKRCQENHAAYGTAKVELLGNDKEVTKELLDQHDVLYLQIARVYPVTTPNSAPSSPADLVVSQFQLDLAHSDQHKQQQQVASQGRKKIFYTTMCPFPAFARRLEIVDTRLMILTPLQNALQLMEERVAAVRSAVRSANATVISGLLYGNLMTTISEGPEAVAEGFLGDRQPNAETDHLRDLVREFVILTATALDTHERLMAADMKEWQSTARKRFDALKDKLAPYL